MPTVHYHVDEAGDGVLFGLKGRDRLADADANRFFILGMVSCADGAADAKTHLPIRRKQKTDGYRFRWSEDLKHTA